MCGCGWRLDRCEVLGDCGWVLGGYRIDVRYWVDVDKYWVDVGGHWIDVRYWVDVGVYWVDTG